MYEGYQISAISSALLGHRGMGIGKKLMEYSIQRMSKDYLGKDPLKLEHNYT
jgi:hypothetical protein